jgi:hypothetical protein
MESITGRARVLWRANSSHLPPMRRLREGSGGGADRGRSIDAPIATPRHQQRQPGKAAGQVPPTRGETGHTQGASRSGTPRPDGSQQGSPPNKVSWLNGAAQEFARQQVSRAGGPAAAAGNSPPPARNVELGGATAASRSVPFVTTLSDSFLGMGSGE